MIDISTTGHPTAARRRQSRAVLALADLLGEDLPELDWYAPVDGAAISLLRGVPASRRDPARPAAPVPVVTADRVRRVDTWAAFLRVDPVWEPMRHGGEYCATGWHLGVKVTVRAWLLSDPTGGREQ
ncbi:hypothetical protein ACFOWE_17920 [Planomonospora corallina]|uniref:Uncharacterized protein n=1 Tax=Planomonospora corallina TaxID=1806052 RepID=A0ABV8I7R0_9ACTN